MSQTDAVAVLERVESDESFAKDLESVRENPPAVVEKVHASGFDATPDEIREASSIGTASG
jgi:predicted ribosomally synthesized peptide with nif11-like leader